MSEELKRKATDLFKAYDDAVEVYWHCGADDDPTVPLDKSRRIREDILALFAAAQRQVATVTSQLRDAEAREGELRDDLALALAELTEARAQIAAAVAAGAAVAARVREECLRALEKLYDSTRTTLNGVVGDYVIPSIRNEAISDAFTAILDLKLPTGPAGTAASEALAEVRREAAEKALREALWNPPPLRQTYRQGTVSLRDDDDPMPRYEDVVERWVAGRLTALGLGPTAREPEGPPSGAAGGR